MKKNHIDNYRNLMIEKYVGLSSREQLLIIGVILFCFYFIFSWSYGLVSELDAAQMKRLKTAESDLNSMPNIIERHISLKLRQRQAEKEYENVKLSEGALAHLEKLIKEVAGIPEGYLIKDKASQKFSDQYQQLPFQVSFNTVDFAKLIRFLDELENGEKPLILSSLSLSRSGGRNSRIRVELVASTIEKIQA
jgi:hypothetical protein